MIIELKSLSATLRKMSAENKTMVRPGLLENRAHSGNEVQVFALGEEGQADENEREEEEAGKDNKQRKVMC